jgi:hypothetical protein
MALATKPWIAPDFPERMHQLLPTIAAHKLLEACHEPGCPICRIEQASVVRYLDNHLYENVNSPRWRDRLRASLGFCQEHAWLAVNQRLGDALGFSIIYRDVLNHALTELERSSIFPPTTRGLGSLLRQVPQQTRSWIENVLSTLTPRKHCPACEYREETTRTTLSILLEGWKTAEVREALQTSDGLCFVHLRGALELARDSSVSEALLTLHRAKLEGLRAELDEFIRKNDYQLIEAGFGAERDAWLRAISMVVGSRKND